jgi:hypothetical protein
MELLPMYFHRIPGLKPWAIISVAPMELVLTLT